MHTSFKSILLFLLAALFGAFAQFFYKEGAQNLSGKMWNLFTDWRIILGMILYIGVMIMFVLAFKIGGELSILYPVYATTFIWALVISKIMLNESINLYKIMGVFLIIFGIFLIIKKF